MTPSRLSRGVLELVGSQVRGFFIQMGGLTRLTYEAIRWTFRRPFRFHLLSHQLDSIGVGSTGIIALTGTFTGMVFALQSSYALVQFGAKDLVGPTVVISILRELGPVLTALLVTGRSGSSMAAEIGTMTITEQVDALRVMAINPVQYLVVPRVIATIVMMVLLTVLFDFTGTIGAYIAGTQVIGLSPMEFERRVIYTVDPPDLWIGLIKSAVFGLIISLISCHKGLTVQGSARSVGLNTTQAVVNSSVLVLVSDYFLVYLLYDILKLD